MKNFWLIIVGAMLCVALPSVAAQPKNETKPAKVEVVGEVKIAEPPARPDPTVVPCDPSKDIRTSDLCAQWKAADAARDSANWTVVAAFFSVLSIVAAAIAATAALGAERAWITLEFLHVVPKSGTLDMLKDVEYEATYRWDNKGRSPALEARFYTDWAFVGPNDPAPKFDKVSENAWLPTLAPEAHRIIYTKDITWDDEHPNFKTGGYVYFFGMVTYKDVFFWWLRRQTVVIHRSVVGKPDAPDAGFLDRYPDYFERGNKVR